MSGPGLSMRPGPHAPMHLPAQLPSQAPYTALAGALYATGCCQTPKSNEPKYLHRDNRDERTTIQNELELELERCVSNEKAKPTV